MINSNVGPISHRFRDMASFPLESAHFFIPVYSALNLKMVPLEDS